MKLIFTFILVFCSASLFSQSATYKLVNKKTGAYSNISIRQTDDQLEVNILANWNNKTGTYGQFTGKGVLNDNQCTLQGDKNTDPCRISLAFTAEKLNVEFQDCDNYLLPERFSGTYIKIADDLPGEYMVTSDISYFYSRPGDQTRRKGFLRKSAVLQVEELFEGNWGFATFISEGRHNFGYVKLSDLKLKKTYIYD